MAETTIHSGAFVVFKRVLSAVIGGVAVLILVSTPSLAEAPSDVSARGVQHIALVGAPQRRGRASAEPTDEQNKTGSDALLTSTGTPCQSTEVVLRGQIGEGQPVYEVACASGPGYVLIGSTPPQAVDCIALFGQADIARAADAAADVGMQCQIEANKDVLRVLQTFATEASVVCTVDQGAAVGKTPSGATVYEIGCAGSDGYRLEKQSTGWNKTSCLQIVSSNGRCRYTTVEEQASTLKGWLAGSEGSACDVTQARYMGANANGVFLEARCAVGDGLIARFDSAMAVQQVYPCAIARSIGGGCTLTTPPAVSPPAAR